MATKTHILAIPFPHQGHINPMVQFCKRLATKGIYITLLLTNTSTANSSAPPSLAPTISVEYLYDDDEHNVEKICMQDYIARFEYILTLNLPAIVGKKKYSVMLCDAFMPYAVDICQNLGLKGAVLFTQSSAVNVIYYHYHQGTLEIPKEGDGILNLPSIKKTMLVAKDLPSFIYDKNSYPYFLKLLADQALNFHKADWVLFNSYDKLEEEVVKWMASKMQMKTIGPTIPSFYLDKRLKNDKDYGLSVYESNNDTCINWLEKKENRSVVYMSFGSLANLGEEQMVEIAMGITQTNFHFLWVVKASERRKLPSDFLAKTSEKGLVLNWCPQLEVLAHRTIGCFVTHCGWNSTLEGLSNGVPMVAMPQWTDQPTNAKFVVDVWKIGVRVKVDGKGITNRDEIELCIKEVMEGKKGIELKKKALRWKELAIEAVDEGGSSDLNIAEVAKQFACSD